MVGRCGALAPLVVTCHMSSCHSLLHYPPLLTSNCDWSYVLWSWPWACQCQWEQHPLAYSSSQTAHLTIRLHSTVQGSKHDHWPWTKYTPSDSEQHCHCIALVGLIPDMSHVLAIAVGVTSIYTCLPPHWKQPRTSNASTVSLINFCFELASMPKVDPGCKSWI